MQAAKFVVSILAFAGAIAGLRFGLRQYVQLSRPYGCVKE